MVLLQVPSPCGKVLHKLFKYVIFGILHTSWLFGHLNSFSVKFLKFMTLENDITEVTLLFVHSI
jgi:hypothetical protein